MLVGNSSSEVEHDVSDEEAVVEAVEQRPRD